MSLFPTLNLKKRRLRMDTTPDGSYEKADVPPPPKGLRYLWMLGILIIGSCCIFFLPSGRIRHMKRLPCTKSTSGFNCDGPSYGDIIVKTTCRLWNVNGVPFNLAKRNNFYRAPSSLHILLQDATPECGVVVYWDSVMEPIPNVFTWVAAKDHTEFTLIADGDVLLDRVSAELLDHEEMDQWVAYTYPVTGTVTGNGHTTIRIMSL